METTPLTFDSLNDLSREIRSDLFAGKYSPGDWLKQTDVEQRYGANRFEVRMALNELAVRGLLEHIQNRGYRIASHSSIQRDQLYEVRTIMELAACRLIVVRATQEQIDSFGVLVAQFDTAVEVGSREELRVINFRLHEAFYAMAGNTLLAEEIRQNRERGIPGRTGTWDTVASLRASNADHIAMLDTLRKRDAEGLCAVVYRHLNQWRAFSTSATTE
ncbi:GntR family transcriptional regulator [Pandoraea sp. PE-S2R-1]|uniref:GntR family transcriptional regulator n=1 Tax=Pandoraea sp. PE-S2R-1 TaxID=1986994 RepID=UPI000B40167A|nr:GntR family transcriptional regulator [Pandoraea sp. PE-S2R-1]